MRTTSLFAILLVIVLAGDIFTGVIGLGSGGSGTASSCPSSPPSPCWTQVQSGDDSCTIAIGGTSCVKTETFSPAYAITPYGEGVPRNPLVANLNIPAGTASIVATEPSVGWIVPVAPGELFGNTNHRYVIDTTTGLTLTGFGADCQNSLVNTGNPLTSWLQLQYSTDSGVTWSNAGSVLTGIDLTVCGAGIGVGSVSLFETIGPLGLPSQNNLMFRVIGQGDGANSAFFTNIWFTLGTNIYNGNFNCFKAFLSSTQIIIRCLPTVKSPSTILASFSWWAGIKA